MYIITWKMHSISANQTRVIFSCILLGMKSYEWFQNWTSEMYSRVNEKLIYVIDITFGINESIFSGNEQQKV